MHFASTEGRVRRKLPPVRAVLGPRSVICFQMHLKHRDQGLESEENLCFPPGCFVWRQRPSPLTLLFSSCPGRAWWQAVRPAERATCWGAALLEMHGEPYHLSACCWSYLSHWVMLSGHDVACRQTERPVITLGSARPLSKGESPSKISLEIAVSTERCTWGPRTGRMVVLFSSQGSVAGADLQQCWGGLRERGHAGRWGVLLGCVEFEVTSGWRDPGGGRTSLVQSKGNSEMGETNLGILHQRLSNS